MRKTTATILVISAALLVAGCAIPFDLLPGRLSGGTSTTASGASVIRNVRMCTVPQDKQCPADQTTFSPTDPSISVTADITNVKAGMIAIITWKYLGGDSDVAPFTIGVTQVATEQTESVRPVESTIEKKAQDKDWATGDYSVEIRLDAPASEPVTTKFRVK